MIYFRVLLLIASLLLPQQSQALDSSCSWLLKNYLVPSTLKRIDPSDQKALQDLLRSIYEHPQRKLSASERAWVEEFSLQEIVEKVRTEGDANRIKLRNHKITKGAFFAAGSTISLGLIGKHLYSIAHDQVDLEGRINKKYKLKLSGNSREELRFLEDTIECDPNHEWNKLDPLEGTTVEDIISQLLLKNYSGRRAQNGAYLELFDFYKRTGIPICTRFAHRSVWHLNPSDVHFLKTTFSERIPPALFHSLNGLEGIVLVNPEYQPTFAAKKGQGVLGFYTPANKRMELYINGMTEAHDSWVLLHELAHAISHDKLLQMNPKWLSINWNFSPLRGFQHKGSWNPTDYATEGGPEENWAEAFACYYDKECNPKMKKNNLEMFNFVQDTINGR